VTGRPVTQTLGPGVWVPLHLAPVVADAVRRWCRDFTVSRGGELPSLELADLSLELSKAAAGVRSTSAASATTSATTSATRQTAEVAAACAGDLLTTDQAAERLGTGRRHALDVLRAAGLTPAVGRQRPLLWDAAGVEALVDRRAAA